MKPIIFQNFALSVKFELYHLISFISILNISWGVVGYRDNLLLDSCYNILLFIYFLNCVFLSRQWLMIFYTLLMMCTSKFLWPLNVMQRFSSVNNCKPIVSSLTPKTINSFKYWNTFDNSTSYSNLFSHTAIFSVVMQCSSPGALGDEIKRSWKGD